MCSRSRSRLIDDHKVSHCVLALQPSANPDAGKAFAEKKTSAAETTALARLEWNSEVLMSAEGGPSVLTRLCNGHARAKGRVLWLDRTSDFEDRALWFLFRDYRPVAAG